MAHHTCLHAAAPAKSARQDRQCQQRGGVPGRHGWRHTRLHHHRGKAGLNALTLTLAAELPGDRILVNAVCPGWVATGMGGPGGRPVPEGAAGIVWAAPPTTAPPGASTATASPSPGDTPRVRRVRPPGRTAAHPPRRVPHGGDCSRSKAAPRRCTRRVRTRRPDLRADPARRRP
ncbi:SDR family oxidoreductase [Streptomyces echinatus]|uniref:SDR family oxidoreductase n=1 Tax=Streptomyces echinatus TaxID=67293 RepID=UPI0037B09FA5